MNHPIAHIIGAGVAGLAAAVALAKAGYAPQVWEAGPQAGGRCRSYFDPVLNCRIDNGNHLILSGNRHIMRYLDTIGARDTLTGPGEALFPFIDLSTGERWALRPNRGRLPWWLLSPSRRVPGTRALDYLEPLKLAFAKANGTVTPILDKNSVLFRRLWEPLVISALNTAPDEGSARLFWAIFRETLGAGGTACIPLVPREGLSETLVDPAIAYIEAQGGKVALSSRVSRLVFEGDRVVGLDFGDHAETVTSHSAVVLAVPAPVAAGMVPGLSTPDDHRPIWNVHFRIDDAPAEGGHGFIGVVGGLSEWVFTKNDILSVTISAADRHNDLAPDAESLAVAVWDEVRRIYRLRLALPPWRVVKEKRATFAATPDMETLRPGTATQWRNLYLAGDWTNTKLPSTIEGSVASGHTAATSILKNT